MAATTPTGIKGPAIQAPTMDVGNHLQVLRQLKEAVEIGQRLRGDPLDSFVRVSELNYALSTRFVQTNAQGTNNGTIQPGNNAVGGTVGSVLTADSITGSGGVLSPLELINDANAPGANMVYGTNGAGVKGWYAASPTGSQGAPGPAVFLELDGSQEDQWPMPGQGGGTGGGGGVSYAQASAIASMRI